MRARVDQHRHVPRRQLGQFVQQRQRLGVGVRRGRALDFLGDRKPRLERVWRQLDRAAQMREAFVETAARNLHAAGKQHEVRVFRREAKSAPDRSGGGIQLAKTQVRKPEVRPRRRLPRHGRRDRRELTLRVVEKADLERREPADRRRASPVRRLRSPEQATR